MACPPLGQPSQLRTPSKNRAMQFQLIASQSMAPRYLSDPEGGVWLAPQLEEPVVDCHLEETIPQKVDKGSGCVDFAA